MGPSGYANALAVQDALYPLLTMAAPPETITSPVALRSVAGIDEKMHEDREESKAEIPLGQKSGVQIGTGKNGQAVSDRNTRVKHGGASRDRTDDLIVANDALSQLSYSPTGREGCLLF